MQYSSFHTKHRDAPLSKTDQKIRSFIFIAGIALLFGLPTTVKATGSGTFVMIHFEAGYKGRLDDDLPIDVPAEYMTMDFGWQEYLFETAEKLVQKADDYGFHLTLAFNPQWAEYILLDSVKTDTVRQWQARGHEIAFHHHPLNHPDWNGYSNDPNATNNPIPFLGNVDAGLDFIRTLAAPTQATTAMVGGLPIDMPQSYEEATEDLIFAGGGQYSSFELYGDLRSLIPTETTTLTATLLFLSILTAQGAPGDGFTFDRFLKKHDANGDGVVTQSEFSGPQQMFIRLDSDQDNSVTRSEFERAKSSRRGNRSGGGNRFEQGRKRYTERAVFSATTHRDLEYAVADGESLKLDLYLPEKTKTAPPLMVWIHGGGWKNGDKAQVNSAILRLSEEGYAVASINYRLEDLTIHPKQIHDCKGAIRWLRAHADEYGYDATRIAVGGGSAGGHLALLLGLSGGVEELEGTVGGNMEQTGTIRAILDLYGPSELNVMAETSERFKRAHRFDTEQLADASPLTYLTPDDPPVLILHGDQDRVVSVEQSLLLHERYQDAGLTSELHILKGAGHGGSVFSDEQRYQIIKTFLEQTL